MYFWAEGTEIEFSSAKQLKYPEISAFWIYTFLMTISYKLSSNSSLFKKKDEKCKILILFTTVRLWGTMHCGDTRGYTFLDLAP